MKSRCRYKGYVIEDGGFYAEFSVEEHHGSGVTETQFYLPGTFPTRSPPSKQRFRLGGRRLMRDLSGDVPC